jgi:hypothetical protein
MRVMSPAKKNTRLKKTKIPNDQKVKTPMKLFLSLIKEN